MTNQTQLPPPQALELMFHDVANTADVHVTAAEAVHAWNLDPARVRRALLILSYDYIHQAHTNDIDPEYDVKSLSRPWVVHTVNPQRHTCTCEDFVLRGNICQHRIAAYLYQQRLKRKSKPTETQLLKDLGF